METGDGAATGCVDNDQSRAVDVESAICNLLVDLRNVLYHSAVSGENQTSAFSACWVVLSPDVAPRGLGCG